MVEPWNDGVRGKQVLPLINVDAENIRVEAGPGTGKTFGLVRRVLRILHPDGLGVSGKDVLVVAFNRVIAKQLKDEIMMRLESLSHDGDPIIRTVHALCLDVIGTQLRLLLPHEREAMLYDVLAEFPKLKETYESHKNAEQALRDHEAKHADHTTLWQAVQNWLTRHRAQVISDLPGLLLDSLAGGDFKNRRYQHVIVDEFQDLTPGEQELFLKLRRVGGYLLALGDPRQSIYAFRGNDHEGLGKLEGLLKPYKGSVTDIDMTECQRCPPEIVHAANQLMGLSSAKRMVSTSKLGANTHVVVWNDPRVEAEGMAKAIVESIRAHPEDHHLAMVTRRQFGYALRDQIAAIDPNLKSELSFSESLLESWAVREAFLFFCLVVDPDPPTWRVWLGYQNSSTGKEYKAPQRSANAYLKLLTASHDDINNEVIAGLATGEMKPAGTGGKNLYERAKRWIDLRTALSENGEDPYTLIAGVFGPGWWITVQTEDAETARLDMQLCLDKSNAMLAEITEANLNWQPAQCLAEVARRLRYQIATREPFVADETADLQIATLWGAKGVTADHVYVLGLCGEAIPGERREEYPGTDADYKEEQRRLFYVSITRSKKTPVLSRASRIKKGDAKHLGLSVKSTSGYWANLTMSPFLRDIIKLLPDAKDGAEWCGCV